MFNLSLLVLILVASNVWELVAVKGESPLARCGHSAVVFNDCIYIFGGMNLFEGVMLNDTWRFNSGLSMFVCSNSAASSTWARVEAGGAVRPRNSHTAVAIGPSMYVFGGADQSGLMLSPQRLDLGWGDKTQTQSRRRVAMVGFEVERVVEVAAD